MHPKLLHWIDVSLGLLVDVKSKTELIDPGDPYYIIPQNLLEGRDIKEDVNIRYGKNKCILIVGRNETH